MDAQIGLKVLIVIFNKNFIKILNIFFINQPVSFITQLMDCLISLLKFSFLYDDGPSPNCKYAIELFSYFFVHPTILLPF